MEKIKRVGQTFKLQYSYSYGLRNIEDGSQMLWYTPPPENSGWFKRRSDAERWLNEKEAGFRLGV